MNGKRALVVGGLVAALAVPAGIAVAATTTPSPNGSAGTNSSGYGPGGGNGRMMGGGGGAGGYGDPEDCPFYDSSEAQQWRAQREQRQQLTPAERQNLIQQHREQMQELMSGAATS